MRYQQNLADGQLAVVVSFATAWPRVQHNMDDIRIAMEDVRPGKLREVPI